LTLPPPHEELGRQLVYQIEQRRAIALHFCLSDGSGSDRIQLIELRLKSELSARRVDASKDVLACTEPAGYIAAAIDVLHAKVLIAMDR
jgi:hypothetical protein